MPTIAPAADIIVGGTAITLGGVGDTLFVMDGIDLISVGAIGADLISDNNAQIHGTVHGEVHGIRMGLEVTGGEVYVGDTGNVSGSQGSAIRGIGDGQGSTNRYSITNDGDVSNHSKEATIHLEGLAADPDLNIVGNDYAVVNNGVISNVHFQEGTAAIRMLNAGYTAQIYNAEDGVISTVGDMGAAIEVQGQQFLEPASGDVRLTEIVFDNAGEVYGEWYSYHSIGRGNDNVTNTGILSGDVALGVNDDRYDGRGGEVIGAVLGEEGDDSLTGGALRDVMSGGLGDDVLRGKSADDLLVGDDGSDIVIGGKGSDLVDGGAGADALRGGEGDDELIGGSGADDIGGGGGSDIISGGTGGDVISGGGEADVINGDGGKDVIGGGAGNDVINGGNQSDEIRGGADDDILTGGSAADTFFFGQNAGHDTLTDFADGSDLFDVSAFAFTGFAADIAPFLIQSGVDVVIDFTFGALATTLTVENEIVANIDATDFVF